MLGPRPVLPGWGPGGPWGASCRPLRAFAAQAVLGEIQGPSQTLGEGLSRPERPLAFSKGHFPSPCTALKRVALGLCLGGRWSGAWLPAQSEDPSVVCLQGHTDILVGVKAEMGTPKLEKPNEGYLEFFVDWSVPRRRV